MKKTNFIYDMMWGDDTSSNNTISKSLVDSMRHEQLQYNIAMQKLQMEAQLQKERVGQRLREQIIMEEMKAKAKKRGYKRVLKIKFPKINSNGDK